MSETLGEIQPGAGTRVQTGTGAAPPPAPRGEVPGGARLRGLSLRLTSGLRFEDNVRRSNRGERRDVAVVLQPRLYLDGQVGKHEVRAGYEGDLASYQRLSGESYLDHNFFGRVNLDLDRRLKVLLDSGLRFGTDPRGELESRVLTSDERDRWREHRASGEITLGRRIARAQIGLRYGLRGLRYVNNAQTARDFDVRTLALRGRYNVGPTLSLLGDLDAAWYDYLDPQSTLDSREYSGLVGVAWEATAKTSGEVRFGLRNRDFNAPTVPSVNGFTWDARVTWAPRSYSIFTAYTSRSVSDSGFSAGAAGSSTVTADTYGLRWRHGINERLTFNAGVERTGAAFEGGGDDEFMSYTAGFRYRYNRRVDLFANWGYDSRSSDEPGADFEAGTVFIGLDWSFDRLLAD